MSKLESLVAAELGNVGLLGHPLLVGVSGGADSLALLHVLKSLLPAERLRVAHVDHGLRPTSAEDAQFVADISQSWGIACDLGRVDVAALAQQQGWSLEQAGREARIAFFAQQAYRHGISAVVVAHHQDDQVESVLLHIVRGAGLAGLAGMQPVASLPHHSDLLLVRPLLSATRADIEAYCRGHGLTPREDASNQDQTFTRNKIRHALLPLLREINPNIRQRMVDLATSAESDNAFLHAQATDAFDTLLLAQTAAWLRLSRTQFAALDVALQRRVLRLAVKQLLPDATPEISFATIEQARRLASAEASGTRSSLPGGLVLDVEPNTLTLRHVSAEMAHSAPQLLTDDPQPLSVPGELALADGWRLTAARVDAISAETLATSDRWSVLVAVDSAEKLSVRPRRPGERFAPFGMDGHTTRLKDAMINWKIPQPLRARWPLVVQGEQVVWVVGFQQDEATRVEKDGISAVVALTCHTPANTQ